MDNLKQFYSKKIDEALNELGVEENIGLTSEEVVKRQDEFGKNQFSKKEETTLLKEILNNLKEPMMVILLIAAFISLIVGETHDFIGIIVAMSVGIGIGIYTEGKSKKAAEALASLTKNVEVKVIRNSIVQNIKKDELVPGDIVYIETGDSIPADGRLIETVDLKIREDMLTGEADDIKKDENFIPERTVITVKGREIYQDPVPAHQLNMVFSGTLVAYGRGKMVVTATGDNSEMGEIAKNLNTEDEQTPIQKKLGDLSATIAKVSGIVSALLFIFICSKIVINKEVFVDTSSFVNFLESIGPIKTAFITCIALIVAAVPEGLPTMVNVTLAVVMQKMAKINALVTKKEACETIGSVSVICSDKTGTITENRMTVEKVNLNGSFIENKIHDEIFLNNCILNSTADITFEDGKYNYLGSATECALLLYNKDIDYRKYREENIPKLQVPFSSSLKRMATVISKDDDDILLIKGAPEILIKNCSFIREREDIVPLTENKKNEILKEIETLQGKSMRTLGFIYKVLDDKRLSLLEDKENILLEEEMIFQGFVGIKDPLRKEVFDSINRAREAGVVTKMLTGDNINTAIAIGRELGLLDENNRAVESGYIDALTDEELREEIKTISIVGRSKPDTKMRIVKALQTNGEVVGVTGDGINDAPALKKADVGIAMGIAGTEVSKGAADIILTDDSFSTIVEGIKWGRSIYDNFQRFIQFQLTVNVVAFLIAIVTQIIGKDMPFTTIQLLWVNIIMDGPPAIALGLEPIRNEVLNRLPKNRNESIISKSMLISIVLNAIYITVILVLQIEFNILSIDITNDFSINQMSTSLFAIFALSALFNAFNAREIGSNSIFKNFFRNKYAVITILATTVIQVIIMNIFTSFFNVVVLDTITWIKIILLSLSVILVNEIIKFFIRKSKN